MPGSEDDPYPKWALPPDRSAPAALRARSWHENVPQVLTATEVALNVELGSKKNHDHGVKMRAPTSPVARALSDGRRSRAPEFYGFVALSSTSVVFVVYVLWALLPDEYIVWLGIKWYPSREWSLLLPAYSIVLVLLAYFVYLSLAIARTPAFNDVNAIVDTKLKGQLPSLTTPNPYLKHADTSIVPELYDIPIGIVNRVLYGPHKAKKSKVIHSGRDK